MAALKWLAILVGLLLILGGGLLGLCGISASGRGDPTVAVGGVLVLLGFLLVAALASRGKREPPADGRSVEKEEEPS